jgi:hypothetical protein
MKSRVLIIVSSLLLLSISSFAQDDDSNLTMLDSTTDFTYENSFGNDAQMQGYSCGGQMQGCSCDGQCCEAFDGCNQNVDGNFQERISYTGDIDWLPKDSICLVFSDDYKWIVHDYRIDRCPLRVGTSNCKPVELIRCYYANYYHVLGTSLVMSIPNPEKTFIKYVPLPC